MSVVADFSRMKWYGFRNGHQMERAKNRPPPGKRRKRAAFETTDKWCHFSLQPLTAKRTEADQRSFKKNYFRDCEPGAAHRCGSQFRCGLPCKGSRVGTSRSSSRL